MIPIATSFAALAEPYSVLLVDVWGVVHNGVQPFEGAALALHRARNAGKAVILISNAPRPAHEIPPQFARIGVSPDICDAVVTSGDATRAVIAGWAALGRPHVHHIGPDRDLALFEGLAIERVPLDRASHVVCTGLVDDETETPEAYEDVLKKVAERHLPFLCANPDIVVQRGDKLVYCAGALAERVEALGGEVMYPGKPHAPIYELAVKEAERILGRPVAKSEILAVGDGLQTDILGATRFGVASVFIVGGIHAGMLAASGRIEAGEIDKACAALGVRPLAAMATLAP